MTGLAASDQVKILKGRKSQDPGTRDTVILKLKAGLNTMLSAGCGEKHARLF